MLAALGRYLERNGYQFDRSVNTLTGGDPEQTVSMRAALGWKRGVLGWCVFCRFLSWAVEADHCAHQFDATPAGALTYIRAGIAFGVGFAALFGLAHAALDLVHAVL